MFLADISKANVMALFLLPSNLLRLREKFLELRPGSRIVSNTFSIQDWEADETVTIDNCEQWCTAMLYIVPAKIGGTWKIGSDVLELKQEYQMLSGTLDLWRSGDAGLRIPAGLPISRSRRGRRQITGRVEGNTIDGTLTDGSAQVLLARDAVDIELPTSNSQLPSWLVVGGWELAQSLPPP